MAFGASTRAIEITHAGVRISRLEIGDVYRAPAAFLCLGFSIVDEGDKRGELLISGGKRRHSLIEATVANHLPDLFSVCVFRDHGRSGQVRAAFPACGVASMAETALSGEERLARLHLLRGISG